MQLKTSPVYVLRQEESFIESTQWETTNQFIVMGKELRVVAVCSLNMNGEYHTSVKKVEGRNVEFKKQEHSLQNEWSISSLVQLWKVLS